MEKTSVNVKKTAQATKISSRFILDPINRHVDIFG